MELGVSQNLSYIYSLKTSWCTGAHGLSGSYQRQDCCVQLWWVVFPIYVFLLFWDIRVCWNYSLSSPVMWALLILISCKHSYVRNMFILEWHTIFRFPLSFCLDIFFFSFYFLGNTHLSYSWFNLYSCPEGSLLVGTDVHIGHTRLNLGWLHLMKVTYLLYFLTGLCFWMFHICRNIT